MKVGFYTAYSRDPIHYTLGAAMIRSVRATMPGVPVVQFTDETSPAVFGVDDVRRLPAEPLCVITARHYSHCEGDWLLVDTDVLVQKDVRPVFEGTTWDLAFTDRIGTLVPGETLFPWTGDYNIGVVFQRNGCAFWRRVVEEILALPEKRQHWMGNQIVTSKLLREGGWNFAVLPGREYNYPPVSTRDDYSHAAIVHFKGPQRKQMLWKRVNGVRQCASV